MLAQIALFFVFCFPCICYAENGNVSKFTYEQLIYNGDTGESGIAKYFSPAVDNQGMDMHSFYDGTYIWYPERNYEDYTNNLIRFNPTDNSITVYPLVDYGSDRKPTDYHAIPDPNDSNIIWVWAAYGETALWKFNKTDKSSEYISGNGVATGSFGGKIASFTQTNGTSKIWGAHVFNLGGLGFSPVAYDEDTDTFTHYTFHPYDDGSGVPGISDSKYVGIYGMQSEGKNLFMANGMGDKGYIYAIHNNFETDGTPIEIATGIYATYIRTSDVATYESAEGEFFTDLAWDGTYLWASGADDTSNKIYRIKPIFDDDGYVTGYYDDSASEEDKLKEYDTGNGWTSLAPSIKANDKYVMAVWEATSNGKFGGLLIDKTDNFSTWNFAGDFEEIYNYESPYFEEIWNTVTVEIDVPGTIYIAGYSPLLQQDDYCSGNPDICSDVTNYMKILKMTFNPELSFSDDVASGSVEEDIITPSWGNAVVKKWDYSDDNLCETSGTYTKTDSDSMNQNTEINNGKYICLYGEDADGNKNTWASSNPINVDISDLEISSDPLSISSVKSFSTSTTITIKWETNNDSDSKVEYGKSKNNLSHKKEDSKNEKDHKITIKNLEPDTTYYFKVSSEDENNSEDESKTYKIKTDKEESQSSITTTNYNYKDLTFGLTNNNQTGYTLKNNSNNNNTENLIPENIQNDLNQTKQEIKNNQPNNTNSNYWKYILTSTIILTGLGIAGKYLVGYLLVK